MHLIGIKLFVDIAIGRRWRRTRLPLHDAIGVFVVFVYLKEYDNEHEDDNTRATDELGA